MGTKMVSLRLDEGLLEWATGFAGELGVSRTSVVERALGALREDVVGGVAGLEDERVPRPVPPAAPKRKPSPPPAVVPPPKQRLQRSEQSRMAMERMRRMDPRRYG